MLCNDLRDRASVTDRSSRGGGALSGWHGPSHTVGARAGVLACLTCRDFDFHGQIDEMWIFDEALDATAVSNLYNFNSTIPESSAVMPGMLAGLLLLRRQR